ncbi:MAG: N-acetylglucosamine-6-phosphate deacetylase [Chloroflexi bacterium]|nr:N-acetylglucosamine-6-phosphate deacetylase [Chloroflexota bacterium]
MPQPDPSIFPLSAILNASFPFLLGRNIAPFLSGGLALADGRIAGKDFTPPIPGTARLDATGCVVLPGFIDLHIHGSAGHDTMDATPQSLSAISAFLARHGVTAFTPTTMTAPHPPTLAAVQNVAAAMAHPLPGAAILGVHLEGPYISPHFPGAQAKADIRPPNLAEFAELVAAGPVKLITLAPEQPGADALIDAALDAGVRVLIGHSAATYEQTIAGFEAGVSQATHTFNAMTGLHHRQPGVVGAVLTDDLVYAQLIADTIHVHPAAMAVLARCKGPDRLLLITDAIRATGMPAGEYELGGQPVFVREGQCRLADGTLAGSILTMESALQHFLATTAWPLERAWPVTSRTPAAALGIGNEYGSLAPGYRADLVVLDGALEVVATIVGGRLVYLRGGEEGRLGQ